MTSLAARSRPAGAAGAGAGLGPVLALALIALACAGAGFALDANPFSLRLTVAAGVGLLAVLGLALWRFKWAVVLAFLLLGLQIVEPAPVDGVLVIIICVAFVTGRFELRDVPIWVVATMGLFIVLNMLSALEAVDTGRAAFYMGVTVYLCAFGLWVAAYVTNSDRARTILTCLVVVGVVSAFFGSLALYVNVPVFSDETFGPRAKALFDDPNIYGPFLVSVSILVLQELLEPRLLARWGRPLLMVLLAILTIGAFLSYSRAAWLNWVVGVVVLLSVLPLRRGGTVRALVLLLVVIAGIGATAATVVVTRQTDFVEDRARFQSYDNERFGAQRLGIEFAETKPLGIGPGQFEILSPVSAHSTYIRSAAEQGLLGFVLVFVLLFGTLLVALQNVISGRDTAGIGSIGLLALWCGMLANSVFIDSLHWRHLFVFAGLIWSGSLAAPAISQASSSAGALRPM